MVRRFDIITFDCYGTLIDWERGIREAFARAAATDGIRIDLDQALRDYASTEALVEQGRYRRYREILAVGAATAARAQGWAVASERAGFLGEELPSWRPFPDTNAALERLRSAGYKLGILSNIDDDLLAATRRHFTVDFDLVITAQQLGSYKPALRHFLTARERIGSLRWLHAAQSNYHDVVPANSIGIATAWINRKGGRALAGGTPAIECSDLASFSATMTT